MEIVISNWEGVRGLAHKFGPYLLVEAVMPGGTLLALLLYLYRARGGNDPLPDVDRLREMT